MIEINILIYIERIFLHIFYFIIDLFMIEKIKSLLILFYNIGINNKALCNKKNKKLLE